MPELPEVEVILHHLHKQVLGGRIEAFLINREDIVRVGFSTASWYIGATIAQISRHGKCLAFACRHSEETRFFVSELGMTGLWFFSPTLASSPQHLHIQLELSQSQKSDLFYWNPRRFGRIWLLDRHEFEEFLQRRFGPDALELNEADFTGIIQNCRGRLKPFLLDQHRLAGIGNIYANEILFRAKIHPFAHGNHLRAMTCQRLFEAMRQTLGEAVQAGGSSIRDFCAPDGTRGHFQRFHQVYHKEHHPCPHGCPVTIRRLPGDRSSFFCPSCQKKS
jgi:formamidopyrimidine-DNA glycosylase